MIKLKTIHYIDTDDVEAILGPGVHWSDCEFAQMAENDSYARLDCSDAALEELYEDSERESAAEAEITLDQFEDEDEYTWHKKRCRAIRLSNQIFLIEHLRQFYGVRDEILIWVCW